MNWKSAFSPFVDSTGTIKSRLDNALRILDVTQGSNRDNPVSGQRQRRPSSHSRRIFLFLPQGKSKAEADFAIILKRNGLNVYKRHRLNRLNYGAEALTRALEDARPQFRRGDILAIVRGGGDTDDSQFAPYRSWRACRTIKDLSAAGVISITGIGHQDDRFPVDDAADYPQATPTDAAYRAGHIVTGASAL